MYNLWGAILFIYEVIDFAVFVVMSKKMPHGKFTLLKCDLALIVINYHYFEAKSIYPPTKKKSSLIFVALIGRIKS